MIHLSGMDQWMKKSIKWQKKKIERWNKSIIQGKNKMKEIMNAYWMRNNYKKKIE